MKLTQSQLRQIIKEELQNSLTEVGRGWIGDIPPEEAVNILNDLIIGNAVTPNHIAGNFMQRYEKNAKENPEAFLQILKNNLELINTISKELVQVRGEYLNNLKKVIDPFSKMDQIVSKALTAGRSK